MRRRRFLKLSAGLLSAPILLRRGALAATHYSYQSVKSLLRQASQYSLEILGENEAAPDSFEYQEGGIVYHKLNTPHFVENCSEAELFDCLDFMIHETTHYVSGALAVTAQVERVVPTGSLTVMPDTNVRLLVPATRVFPSRDIAAFLNPTLRDCSRFDVYVAPQVEGGGCQVYGVYGLLNEFNAYYAGLRACNDLLEFCLKGPVTPDEGTLWVDRLSKVAAGCVPLQEFRGFILGYLAFAKEHHPEVADGVLTNGYFRRGFKALEIAFSTIVEEFFLHLPERVERLSEAGLEIEMGDDCLRSGKLSRPLYSREYLEIKNAVNKDQRLVESEAGSL